MTPLQLLDKTESPTSILDVRLDGHAIRSRPPLNDLVLPLEIRGVWGHRADARSHPVPRNRQA